MASYKRSYYERSHANAEQHFDCAFVGRLAVCKCGGDTEDTMNNVKSIELGVYIHLVKFTLLLAVCPCSEGRLVFWTLFCCQLDTHLTFVYSSSKQFPWSQHLVRRR
jgi:hypothetical protein